MSLLLLFRQTQADLQLSRTLDAVTVVAAGTVRVSGALAVTLGDLTSSAAGTVRVTGSLASTLDALTLSAAGTVLSGVTGSLAQTLDALTVSATGTVAIAGSLARTLDDLTLVAAGTVGAVAAVAARVGWDDGPSIQEWQAYLRRLNEQQIQRMAERVADRSNLREMILEQLRPTPQVQKIIERTPETRIEPLPQNRQPVYRVRQIRLPRIPDAQPAIRQRMAAVMVDIRRRARRIRRKKQEEAVIMLLFG